MSHYDDCGPLSSFGKKIKIKKSDKMERAKLFQYAVIYNPTKEEEKQDIQPSLIVPITTILAKDEREVLIIASRNVPTHMLTKLEQVDIVVRPF